MRQLAKWATAAVAAPALSLGLAAQAQAHDWLVSSNPASGSTVTTAPAQVKLSFNDLVRSTPAKPDVIVTGADGKHYETACATAGGRDVTTAWTPGKPGKYKVTWRIISSDGHPVSDSISFNYQGKPGSNEGKSEAACKRDSGSQAETSKSDDGSSAPLIIGGVVVAVAVVMAGVMIARRKK